MASDNSKDNIHVVVRVRKLISHELDSGNTEGVTVLPNNSIIVGTDRSFEFDRVFSKDETQIRIYEESGKPLVEDFCSGINSCIFAYGQTGSGKTYTMGTTFDVTHDDESCGIVPRIAHDVFEKVKEMTDTDVIVRCSFLEIYNEECKDLLHTPNTNGNNSSNKEKEKIDYNNLHIRENPNGEIMVAGLTQHVVTSAEELFSWLTKGAEGRTVHATKMNNVSSRSHAIVTIYFDEFDKTLNISSQMGRLSMLNPVRRSKLHLIDLAGSERAKKTQATGQRFKEGVNINKGLLALGSCINALSDPSKANNHVPFRDSKLTRILQDSLGGNCKTVMIACVSPADSNFDESANTLRYAARARNIAIKPVANLDPVAAEMMALRKQIANLQQQVSLTSGGTGITELFEENSRLLAESNKSRAHIKSLTEQLREESERSLVLNFQKAKLEAALHGGSPKEEAMDEDLLESVDPVVREQLSTINSLKSRVAELEAELGADDIDSDDDDDDEEDNEEGNEESEVLREEMNNLDRELESKEAAMAEVTANKEKQEDITRNVKRLETEVERLSGEKSRLLSLLSKVQEDKSKKSSNSSNTASAQRYREKLKKLEHQITELKEQKRRQSRTLSDLKKSAKKAEKLQKEISNIKRQKVQLMQKQQKEAERYRQLRLDQNRQMETLKRTANKKSLQMKKMSNNLNKRHTVMQRRMEQLNRANSKLKEALQRSDNAHKREQAKLKERQTAAHKRANTVTAKVKRMVPGWLEIKSREVHTRSAREDAIRNRSQVARQIADIKKLIPEGEVNPALKRSLTSLELSQKKYSAEIAEINRTLSSLDRRTHADPLSLAKSLPEAHVVIKDTCEALVSEAASKLDLEEKMQRLSQEVKSYQTLTSKLKRERKLLKQQNTTLKNSIPMNNTTNQTMNNSSIPQITSSLDSKEQPTTSKSSSNNRRLSMGSGSGVTVKRASAGGDLSERSRKRSRVDDRSSTSVPRGGGRSSSLMKPTASSSNKRQPKHSYQPRRTSSDNLPHNMKNDDSSSDSEYEPAPEEIEAFNNPTPYIERKKPSQKKKKAASSDTPMSCSCGGKCIRGCPCRQNGRDCGAGCLCNPRKCTNCTEKHEDQEDQTTNSDDVTMEDEEPMQTDDIPETPLTNNNSNNSSMNNNVKFESNFDNHIDNNNNVNQENGNDEEEMEMDVDWETTTVKSDSPAKSFSNSNEITMAPETVIKSSSNSNVDSIFNTNASMMKTIVKKPSNMSFNTNNSNNSKSQIPEFDLGETPVKKNNTASRQRKNSVEFDDIDTPKKTEQKQPETEKPSNEDIYNEMDVTPLKKEIKKRVADDDLNEDSTPVKKKHRSNHSSSHIAPWRPI